MLRIRDISNKNSVLKARGKRALVDVICYNKMTSVMALGGVTSFLRLKYVTHTYKVCDTVQLFAGVHQFNSGTLEEAEDFKCVFVVYCVFESK